MDGNGLSMDDNGQIGNGYRISRIRIWLLKLFLFLFKSFEYFLYPYLFGIDIHGEPESFIFFF